MPHRTLRHPAGLRTVSTSVGSNGEAIRLLADESLAGGVFARTEQPGGASFPKSKTEREYAAILAVSDASGSREIRVSGLTATFPMIQMLPNDDVLVVSPRCQRYPDGSHELNAKVYDSAGVLRREFLLGDGISHVQADASGNIWVGYSDEGVYGNFGWQHADTALGTAGLSCFSNGGQKLWDFQPPEGFDSISDCYALNVSRVGVWTYYYTDFPFARIDTAWRVRCWNTGLAGGGTFAVGGERILLYGGYGENRTSCKLLQLRHEKAELIAEVSLVFPAELDLSEATVIGRDKELHVFFGDDWYTFSIESPT